MAVPSLSSTLALPFSVGALSLPRAPGLKLRVKSEYLGSLMLGSLRKEMDEETCREPSPAI